MIRPLRDWMVVRLHPLPERSGSIILPHGGPIRTGEVLAVGKTAAKEVRVGEHIAFRREHLEHQQGKQVGAVLKELGDNLGMLRAMDVLMVIEPGTSVTV